MLGRAATEIERANRLARTTALLRLAVRDPIELYDRVRARIEVTSRKRRPVGEIYESAPAAAIMEGLATVLGATSVAAWQREFDLLTADLQQHLRSLPPLPLPPIYDADPQLARLVYVATRALKPEVVAETGVALGIVSSCILTALERNGRGRLISVDLPPLGVQSSAIGAAVPDRLRRRWTLVRGSSTRLLPRALAGQPPVGLFVQDSLFTWRNSTAEFAHIIPRLSDRWAIVANCIQHSRAFEWLVQRTHPSFHAVAAAETKTDEIVGLAVHSAEPGQPPARARPFAGNR